MLVIIVAAAAVATAALAFLRSRQMLQRPVTGPPTDACRIAASESDNSGPDPQPRNSPAEDVPESAQIPAPAVATAPQPTSPPTPARTRKDLDELEFSLEVLPNPAAAAASNEPAPNVTSVTTLQPAAVFSKLFDLALGKPRPPAELHAGHAEIVASVNVLIDDDATLDRYVPRRPNMLPKVLSASNDDRFSRTELAALIARDPSLVGNLLKIANSSYYRLTPEPVESVDRAVVLLGTDGIRSLVTAALMQPIFRIGGADFPRFPEIAWEHTFRSASAAVAYNFLMEKSDPFAAELLSLVMGLAEIVIFRVTLDQYSKNQRLRADAGIVASLIDTHAASVAHRIGTTWELSDPTLAGLDGQTIDNTSYPTALGRSLHFGRVVGALAVLRLNRGVDDEVGKASIPATGLSEQQLERMWTRLTHKPDEH